MGVEDLGGYHSKEEKLAAETFSASNEKNPSDIATQQKFQELCLNQLKTTDADWFYQNYSGELSPDGYLLDRAGNTTNFLPSQNISHGIDELMAQARTESGAEILSPEPETNEVKQTQEDSLSTKKDKVIASFENTRVPTYQEVSMPLMNNPDMNQLGNAIQHVIYPKLVGRENIVEQNTEQLFKDKRLFAQNFVDQARTTDIPVKWARGKGEKAFHFKNNPGEKSIDDGFAYYFNKSMADWRPFEGDVQRAYLTIKPELVKEIPKYFVELTKVLNDAGIDFYSKAASPWQAAKRNDTMVFYISPNDKAAAEELIGNYLQAKNAFSGEVLSAQKDSNIDGLSWGVEPTQEDVATWQKATGDSSGISYSQSLGLKMAPAVFNAIAQKHYEAGDQAEFSRFRQLAIEASDAQAL